MDTALRLIVVGGVAGGATAAARARRLSEDAEIIVFERGEHVSFANCGLPYYVGREIDERESLLLETPESLHARYRLDVRARTEVLAIERAEHRVRARDLESGREYTERYDRLILSPGAAPIRPPLPGIEHPRIFSLRTVPDIDKIKAMVDGGARRAVVVGGGFIGLEMAENLRRRGLEVALVELLDQVMPPFDKEMVTPVHEELRSHGVALHLADAVAEFEHEQDGVTAVLESGRRLPADLVVLCIGVRPETSLAAEAGLEIGPRGGIHVDDDMRTSDPDIYAVGDAIEVRDCVVGGTALIPLAGPANRQGRIAADRVFGREEQVPRHPGHEHRARLRPHARADGCKREDPHPGRPCSREGIHPPDAACRLLPGRGEAGDQAALLTRGRKGARGADRGPGRGSTNASTCWPPPFARA